MVDMHDDVIHEIVEMGMHPEYKAEAKPDESAEALHDRKQSIADELTEKHGFTHRGVSVRIGYEIHWKNAYWTAVMHHPHTGHMEKIISDMKTDSRRKIDHKYLEGYR